MLELFGFTRAAFEHGEYWRLLSSQFVHLNPSHLFWNLLALLVSAWVCHFFVSARTQALSFLGGLIGVAYMLMVDTSCSYYAGLSGALHGLWAGNILALIFATRHEELVLSVCVLIALLMKMTIQETSYPWVAEMLETPVYLPSHWAGLLGAMLMITAVSLFRSLTKPLPQADADN